MIKIGILTYFASINYGAFLQAYALQKAMEKKYGYIANVELINYDTVTAHQLYHNRLLDKDGKPNDKMVKQYNKFVQCRAKQRLSEESIITNDIEKFRKFLSGKYDIIIVGSDEIWKTDSFRGFPTAYWLNFDLQDTVYMAYAVSGRNNYQIMNSEMKQYIRNAIKRFLYIGTRDEVTKEELIKIENRVIYRNCDPTFLMPELFYINDKAKIIEKYGLDKNRPLVSIMLKDNEIGTRLYRMLKNENQVLYLYYINENISDGNWVDLSPFEWSEIIGISDLVITDFFHGTVFSILHEVPFVAIENEEKGRGKIESLLLENHMESKFTYISKYRSNYELAATDIYMQGRKEMKNYTPILANQTKKRELQKADSFFIALEEKFDRG